MQKTFQCNRVFPNLPRCAQAHEMFCYSVSQNIPVFQSKKPVMYIPHKAHSNPLLNNTPLEAHLKSRFKMQTRCAMVTPVKRIYAQVFVPTPRHEAKGGD